jgi:flagellar motor switch protein FliG
MDAVEQANPTLSENIRRFMFVFKDLEDLDKASLTALVQACNRSTLVIALKGANESLRQKFLATQSQRGAAMMADDLAALGPVRLRDVEAAQQEIINLARDLEKDGVVSLKNAATEQYVY